MSTTKIEVLTVNCDDCGDALSFEDSAITAHIDPTADIAKELKDWCWTVTDKGEHLCEACTCGRGGHELKPYKGLYGKGYSSCDCGNEFTS